MRRLRSLVAGLPADAAIWRQSLSEQPEPRHRSSSSFDQIRKAGGKVVEIRRDKAG